MNMKKRYERKVQHVEWSQRQLEQTERELRNIPKQIEELNDKIAERRAYAQEKQLELEKLREELGMRQCTCGRWFFNLGVHQAWSAGLDPNGTHEEI